MSFWLRKIIFTAIIVGLAITAYLNSDLLMTLINGEPEEKIVLKAESTTNADKSTDKITDKITDKKTNDKVEPPTKKIKKSKTENYSKNAAAAGLSRFYASINPDDDDGPKIINGLVFLPDPKDNFEKFMEARRMVTRPLPKKWKGTTKSYAFRKGQTLYQKLSEYAKKDKLEVIWRLNRDLLVKDPFRINKNLFKMAYQIGQAISGHFPGGVSTYFCYKHRAIVLIEYSNKYLNKQCILLKSSSY